MAADAPVGKSELREDLCPEEGGFSQEYFVYCKKNRRSPGAKHPQGAEDERERRLPKKGGMTYVAEYFWREFV
ncbi:MAG: hypothetical protein IJK63_05890 [Oscillospiraceae bacterium]|nr:hypothetical protein [Oscillospiraceae bacterium]